MFGEPILKKEKKVMDKYSQLKLTDEQLCNSIHLQVLAHHNPKRINRPSEPWIPANQLDRILKDIKDNGI